MLSGKVFIKGEYVECACKRTVDVISPATGELLGTVPDSDADVVNRAVEAARQSFEKKTWRGLDSSKRERILWTIGELLLKYKDELARTIALENGKTLREAAGGDVAPAADCFRYYAGWVRRIYGQTIPVDGPYFNYTLREPVGVVGAIVPWNFPVQIAAWKVAPALACGCSEGFSTTEQPQASAGATFHAAIWTGKFHGTIAPTTPTGSRRV